ncbi:MAG TPA: hypothetical protein VLH38_00065 [Patescibacteria group bacterium]|nr:hypothetical protein [Patescibacteria group bacterium]
MNEDVIVDLNQFISGTVTQQVSEIKERLDGIDQKIDNLLLQLPKRSTAPMK